MQQLFPIDENFLLAISRLEDEDNPNWAIIQKKISEVSTITTQQNLHGFPDSRLNFRERFDFMRGFSAALDLLKNIFNNPSQLIAELKEQDEFTEAQDRAREEGLIE
jgi:hypothetical protein